MEWTKLIITLGESLSYLAFWVGFILVAMFANNRFKQSKVASESDDPQVKPRSFTTGFRYFLSVFVYVGCYEFFYGLLVGIGSLPVLQELLTQWIGGLAIPEDIAATSTSEATEVGTPAWAALFVTAVLPSAPGFDKFDRKILKALHRFASIPSKARVFAKIIIDNLTSAFLAPNGNAAELESEGPVTYDNEIIYPHRETARLDWLLDAADILQNSARNGENADEYQEFFFGDYRAIWADANAQRAQIMASIDPSQAPTPSVIHQLVCLRNSCARLLSCALLQNESSERAAREKIRELLGLTQFPRLEFDFKAAQIILNLIISTMVTFFISLVVLFGYSLPDLSKDLKLDIAGLVGFWLIPISITMVTPFVFAAGVQLYFMDHKQATGKSAPLETKLIFLFCLFAGTFAVGTLPTLLGMVVGEFKLTANWILQVVPSGLTPACVALLFYFMSSHHRFESRMIEAVLDFIAFAFLAAACTYLVASIAHTAGMDFSEMTGIDELTHDVVVKTSVTTQAVMVGVLGLIQCYFSRSDLLRQKLFDEQAAN